SVAQMANEFGGTLGAALLGTIGFAVYRHEIAGAIPAGTPAGPAAAARDSLLGAVTAAPRLPNHGASLLTSAHHAFVNGLATAAGVGAALLGTMAVLIAILLRHVPPIGQAPPGARD